MTMTTPRSRSIGSNRSRPGPAWPVRGDTAIDCYVSWVLMVTASRLRCHGKIRVPYIYRIDPNSKLRNKTPRAKGSDVYYENSEKIDFND